MKVKINSKTKVVLFSLIISIISMVAPPMGVGLIYLAMIYFSVRNDEYSLLFFVCSILVQNLTLLIGAYKFGGTLTTLFSLSKEIMLYGCVCLYGFKNHMAKKHTFVFILFLFLMSISFLLSDVKLFSKIISVRQLLLPFICFYFGVNIKYEEHNMENITKIIVISGIVIGVFGIIETFVIGDSIWTALPMEQYQANKGTTFTFYNGVPLNYYTWDYYSVVGKPLRRMVSIFVDPLMTGHYLFLGFLLADNLSFEKLRIKWVKFFLFVCSILTLCKGIYIAYIVYFVFILIKKLNSRSRRIALFSSIGLFAIGFVAVYSFAAKYLSTSSILIHMNGFIDGIVNSGIIGAGLGKAGVMVQQLSGSETTLTNESYLGVLSSQLGLVGLSVFLVFFVSIILQLLKKIRFDVTNMCFVSIVLLSSVILESFFSESSISIVGTGIYFIYAGIYNRKVLLNNKF